MLRLIFLKKILFVNQCFPFLAHPNVMHRMDFVLALYPLVNFVPYYLLIYHEVTLAYYQVDSLFLLLLSLLLLLSPLWTPPLSPLPLHHFHFHSHLSTISFVVLFQLLNMLLSRMHNLANQYHVLSFLNQNLDLLIVESPWDQHLQWSLRHAH